MIFDVNNNYYHYFCPENLIKYILVDITTISNLINNNNLWVTLKAKKP